MVFDIKMKKSIMPEELILIRLPKWKSEFVQKVEQLVTGLTCRTLFLYESKSGEVTLSDVSYEFIDAQKKIELDKSSDKKWVICFENIVSTKQLDQFLIENAEQLKTNAFLIDPTVRYSQDFSAYCSQFIAVGQRILEVDLTNYCTHNCVYCGLYSDESNDLYIEQKGEKAHKDLLQFKRKRLDINLLYKLIDELPYSIERVVLGGVGDPFLYPEIMDVIKKIRNKGIYVVVYSNMSYLNRESIDELHSLVKTESNELMIIANVSGMTAKTYLAVRSNQTEEVFDRVMDNLGYIGELRARDLFGIKIQLMAVVNTLNYHELPLFALKAKALNVFQLWFKPMEVYSPVEKKYEINIETSSDYFLRVAEALEVIDRYNIITNGIEVMQSQVDLYSEKIDKEIVQSNVQKLLKKNVEDVKKANDMFCLGIPDIITDWKKILKKESRVVQTKWRVSKQKLVRDDRGIDSGVKEDFYDHYPCYMPEQYLRIFTDEQTKFCCVFPNFLDVEEINLKKIICSNDVEKYRKILKDLPHNRAHQSNDIYRVCRQCPHVDFNVEYLERIMRIKLGLNDEQ